MKKLFLLCLATLLLGQHVFAMWAAHLVVSPIPAMHDPKRPEEDRFATQAAEFARGVTVRPAEKGRVSIVLKATEEKGELGKVYYLMIRKKRLPANKLDLRAALAATNRKDLLRGELPTGKEVPEGFVEVRPLQAVLKDGESVIELELDREVALRSYVVWDFRAIYEKCAAVMDGGLYLTYDLPAFVEGMEAVGKKVGAPKAK